MLQTFFLRVGSCKAMVSDISYYFFTGRYGFGVLQKAFIEL